MGPSPTGPACGCLIPSTPLSPTHNLEPPVPLAGAGCKDVGVRDGVVPGNHVLAGWGLSHPAEGSLGEGP